MDKRQRADGTWTWTSEAWDASYYWPEGTRVSFRGEAGTVIKENTTTVRVQFDSGREETGRIAKSALVRL